MVHGEGESKTLEMRRELKEDHEPLLTRDREVYVNDSSFYVNIPDEAKQIIGVAPTDKLEIEIYEEGIFVKTGYEPER